MTAEDATAIPRRFWIAMGAVCLVLAAMAAHQVSVGNWFTAAFPVLAIAGIAGRLRWGRRLAVGLHWLLLVAGFGAVMPPEKGVPVYREMPPVEVAMIEAAVLVAVALLCLHLLGRWKTGFRAAWI
jgi:hypothetical protein